MGTPPVVICRAYSIREVSDRLLVTQNRFEQPGETILVPRTRCSCVKFVSDRCGPTQTRTEDLSIIRAGESVLERRAQSQQLAKWLVERAGQGVHRDMLRTAEARSDGIVGTWERRETEQRATREFPQEPGASRWGLIPVPRSG